jgi:thymidylate synthase (FAD)
MKIVKPSVSLLWITPNAEQMIERAGRVAYKSEDKITPDSAPKFIKMIIDRGHEAVIEHASASLLFVTDRGVTHEIVRHRLFSYVQESTRYCNYGLNKFGNEITVIEPPSLEGDALDNWNYSAKIAEDVYKGMISRGVSPQIARSVLPNCLKTEIVVTGNLREWRHFFRLRMAKAAHPQMRQIAVMAFGMLHYNITSVFADMVPWALAQTDEADAEWAKAAGIDPELFKQVEAERAKAK